MKLYTAPDLVLIPAMMMLLSPDAGQVCSLAFVAGACLYSTTRSYYGMKGLIEIDFLDSLIITV